VAICAQPIATNDILEKSISTKRRWASLIPVHTMESGNIPAELKALIDGLTLTQSANYSAGMISDSYLVLWR